jgi:hypothetical protein
LRAAGALIEEEVDDEDEDADVDGDGELVLDEKAALASDAPASRVVDVPLKSRTERADTVGVGSWMSGRSSVTNPSVIDCKDIPH